MMYMSRFAPDPSRTGEFLAGLWQGEVPSDLVLHNWLYVEGEPREVLLHWEGGEPAMGWVDRAMGQFGTIKHEIVDDATGGLAGCLARDLDGFRDWLAARGMPAAEIESQLDVRRRGLNSATQADAMAAGQAWTAERAAD
jgi:hypothetical protein